MFKLLLLPRTILQPTLPRTQLVTGGKNVLQLGVNLGENFS